MQTMYNIQLEKNFWRDLQRTISIPMFRICQKIQCVMWYKNQNSFFASNTAITHQKGIFICRGTKPLLQISSIFSVSWYMWHVSVLTKTVDISAKLSLAMVGLLHLHQICFWAQCLVFAALFLLFLQLVFWCKLYFQSLGILFATGYGCAHVFCLKIHLTVRAWFWRDTVTLFVDKHTLIYCIYMTSFFCGHTHIHFLTTFAVPFLL